MTDWKRILRQIAPHGRADIVNAVAAHADEEFENWEITTPLRQAHFFAHAFVESAGFTQLEEGLSYSANRLCQVWPKRFPTLAVAQQYAHNPQKLAEKVYGGRMGNTSPGDGFKFRGKGLMQETGRSNHEQLAEELEVSLETVVSWLTLPEHLLACACARFYLNGALKPADRDDITASTKAINGGTNGLRDRRTALALAKRALQPVTTAQKRPVGVLSVDSESDDGSEDLTSHGPLVEAAQKRLAKLNYPVGEIDGNAGGQTRGQLYAFQLDHGLETTGTLTPETISALGSEMTDCRPIAPARANATVDDLRQKGSETIKAADEAEAGGSNVGVVAGVAGAASGVQLVTDAVTTASSAKDTADKIPDISTWVLTHLPLLFIIAACVFLWFQRKRIRAAVERVWSVRLKDHQNFSNAKL